MAADAFDVDEILARAAEDTLQHLRATTDLDARLEDIMRRNGRDRDGNPAPATDDATGR